MEKYVRLTWGEVIKWIVLVAGISTTYAVMQTKIHSLEDGRVENRQSIEQLEKRMQLQEQEIASIKSKLDNIGADVTVIKNAIINSSYGTHQ